MDLTEFFAANETIERDPVKRLNAGTARICERIVPDDFPPDIRLAVLRSRFDALHGRAKSAIESGRADLIESILADFANDLRGVVQLERERLRANTSADEVKRHARVFEENLYNGFECGVSGPAWLTTKKY